MVRESKRKVKIRVRGGTNSEFKNYKLMIEALP